MALRRVWRELQETEKELELVERDARQVQQRAESVEQRWRKINIRRQLVEWQRLKGLSQGLAEAEQHLQAAHMRQEKLTIAENDAKNARNRSMGIFFAVCAGFALLFILAIVFFASKQPTVGAVS